MVLKEEILRLSQEHFSTVRDIRRHIHQYPELSFQEYNTAKYIISHLKALNISYTEGVAGTGIVAHVEGKDPQSRVFALRADMDALPILEVNAVAYKSANEGVMHACGHDVHTACLLGAAYILTDIKDHIQGTIKLIFQPGEEKLPGGASLMIKEGALKDPKPEGIIAQHVYPPLVAGKVGFRPGKYMASSDEIYITVKGKGGHAAMPHNCTDPIVIASEVILALQQVTSRRADPTLPSVLSFGKIVGNGATNVIPQEVTIEGTFRTYDEDWRKEAHKIIKEMVKNICAAHGGSAEVDIKIGYPHLINHEGLTGKAISLAKEILGNENVVELPLRMTAEDFAYYSQVMPACFYRLGTGNEEKNISSPVHTPTFDIDEDALKTGMALMAWLAVKA